MSKVQTDAIIPLLKEGDVVTRFDYYYVVYGDEKNDCLMLRSLLNPSWTYGLNFLKGDTFRLVTNYDEIDCRSKWQREQDEIRKARAREPATP